MRTAFDVAYEGTPTWEIGRPQAVVVRLAEEGMLAGSVIDMGCGTGAHALLVGARGQRVTGIDFAPAAIARARAAAARRGIPARFILGDVLALDGPADTPPAVGGPFDTALDVGLFHVLQPLERRRYAAGLATVVRPGGRAFIVAWSDRNPFGYGPARVRRADLRSSFQAITGWRVDAVEPATLETNLHPGHVHAWLARLTRR